MKMPDATRLTRRQFLGAGAAVSGATLLAACTPSTVAPRGTAPGATGAGTAAPASIQRGGTLILGTPQPVQHLDPHKTGLANNRNAWGLWNGLTRWGPDGVPGPELAESWQMRPDGLAWTFKLRPGVKFHNGRGMTADDVKFSLDRVLDPASASPLRTTLADITEVQAIDPLTVALTLSAPTNVLLPALADVKIVAKENVRDIDTKAVGTGPFKLKEYAVGERLVLEKFPDYWQNGADGGRLPYLDGVTVNTLTDPTALFTALNTGGADVFYQMTPQFVVQLERAGQQDQVLWSHLKTAYTEFFFEINRGVFQDRRVREALLYALDKQAILEGGYFGFGDPRWNNNIIAPGSIVEKTDLPELKRDPMRARQLFEAAGVKELKFLGTAISAEMKPIAEVMERNLNEIGVTLKTELFEINAWVGVIGSRKTQPWRDLNAFAPNIAFRAPVDAIVTANWGCNKYAHSHWCNEEMDRYSTQARQALNPAASKEAWSKYQEVWQREIPAIIHSYRGVSHGVSKRVRNLENAFGFLDYRGVWLAR